MDSEFKYIPEIGRGCCFRDGGDEAAARPCGGCSKLHETPWLGEYPDNIPSDIFEVRFKNTRRSFYRNVNNLRLKVGDIVAVEASPGHDIGIISLAGDMVAKQIRRLGFTPYNGEYKKIYRLAKPYDIERWQEAIALEHDTMIRSRQIAADMGLNMKIGDVEYQGDKIKAIFYYIADERVDFRELIKVFAEQFHIRIEMKQIGARQEAGRIGGIGACGRELCCTSWISNFSSVTTNAARMQEISLNPQKLAGQCSKLKCCMVYEYDTYADARRRFPRLREPLQTVDGEWYLVKNDILAGTMQFSSSKETLSNLTSLPVARVKEILAANRAGHKVDSLLSEEAMASAIEEPTYRSGSDEDSITRFDKTSHGKRRRNRKDSHKDNRDKRGDRREASSDAPAESQRENREGGSRSGNRHRNATRQEREGQHSSDSERGERQQRNREERDSRANNRGERSPERRNSRRSGNRENRDDSRRRAGSSEKSGSERPGAEPNEARTTPKRENAGKKSDE
ncbi:MAG: hypothetical protein K2J51_06490 [Alistipes sp.]|nr:hypothetical protein [Alistipes sp.]